MSEEKIVKKAVFTQLQRIDNNKQTFKLDMLNDVDLKLEMKLGETVLPLSEVRKFCSGYLIPMKKDSTDVFVDIYIGKKRIGKGEVVIFNDEIYIRIIDTNN